MRFSARLQLLACLMVYVSSAHAIMVKFGTKEGPIEPPTPEPVPSPQPYRNPAPVWEERSNDTPDPNAQWRVYDNKDNKVRGWTIANINNVISYKITLPISGRRYNYFYDLRPPFFKPNPRYTHVVYNPPSSTLLPINSAQRFVNAYIPVNKPVEAVNQGNPSILSSQTLPGIGLRYFFPAYTNEQQRPAKQEDAKLNHIDADLAVGKESSSDFQWKYEKDVTRRIIRNNQESTAGVPGIPVYQFPVYVQPRHR